jgi:hypothetical protein
MQLIAAILRLFQSWELALQEEVDLALDTTLLIQHFAKTKRKIAKRKPVVTTRGIETSTAGSSKRIVDRDKHSQGRRWDDHQADASVFVVGGFLLLQCIGIFMAISLMSDLRGEVQVTRREHAVMKQNMYSVTQRCEAIYKSAGKNGK